MPLGCRHKEKLRIGLHAVCAIRYGAKTLSAVFAENFKQPRSIYLHAG
jgi:hypothetical protein